MPKTKEEKLATKRDWQRRHRAANPEKYREIYRAANKKRPKNKIKSDARQFVMYAVQFGILIRPEICDVCRQVRKVDAHHTDYTKPLLVDWLCRACHGKQHRKEAAT